MPKAIQITRTDYTAQQLKKEAKKATKPNVVQRILAIVNVLDGINRKDAAEKVGMERQTLRDWCHRYNEYGIEGLYNKKQTGAKPRITEEQKQSIRKTILESPEKHGYNTVRWRCSDAKDFIEKQYGVVYTENHVGKIMKKLGLSWISARPRHPKSSPETQETFKKTSQKQ